MKVSTSQMFELATTQMVSQQSKVSDMQAQLASGKQMVRPSDNPEQGALIQRLTTALNRQDVYAGNLETVSARMGSEESALTSSENIMQRIREIAVQGNSETLSGDDRIILAKEVSALRNELVSLSNTRDVSGNYVFAGSMTNTRPFAENGVGEIAYQGDQTQVMVDVSDQRQLVLNRPGNEAFTSVIRETDGISERVNFFAVIDDFTAALKANDSAGLQVSLAEVSDLTQNLALAIADVGSRLGVVDSQADILADTRLRYQSLLSGAEDLDYASAITQLTSEIMSLEAGQSSFAKISQLSLFDYIR